ncbi:hypothetical protein ACH49M_21400 [Rhodococcus qingshengii]|uniref:hypothetical protein n=1 Tax=Rhodococcus qingshengii TaxID=334542 RepID=UPI0036FE9F84
MTAPDPGLTDLIATHVLSGPYIEYDSDGHHADDFYRCGENCKWTSNEGTVNRSAFAAHAAHVALVVEQHTKGRIASDLGADPQDYEIAWAAKLRWQARAEKAEATIARVEKLAHDMRGWCSPHGISVTYSDRIRAALEGE